MGPRRTRGIRGLGLRVRVRWRSRFAWKAVAGSRVLRSFAPHDRVRDPVPQQLRCPDEGVRAYVSLLGRMQRKRARLLAPGKVCGALLCMTGSETRSHTSPAARTRASGPTWV